MPCFCFPGKGGSSRVHESQDERHLTGVALLIRRAATTHQDLQNQMGTMERFAVALLQFRGKYKTTSHFGVECHAEMLKSPPSVMIAPGRPLRGKLPCGYALTMAASTRSEISH